jgi:hypothetical protein
MVLWAGYFFIDSSGSSLSVENPVVSQQPTISSQQEEIRTRLSVGMEAIEKAKDIKAMADTLAAEVMEQGVVSEESSSIKTSDGQAGSDSQQTSKSSIENLQPKIVHRLVSFGYAESSGRRIETVVLHSSYNNQGGDRYSVDKVIDIWKSYEVAPHYMIDRKGDIFRLVEDEDIAYHAGNSKMPDGRTNVNGFSIGVEILNAEDDEYTAAQYEAVNDLIAYLKKKYGVKYVVGHADIAPGRKTDPWNFDWKRVK